MVAINEAEMGSRKYEDVTLKKNYSIATKMNH